MRFDEADFADARVRTLDEWAGAMEMLDASSRWILDGPSAIQVHYRCMHAKARRVLQSRCMLDPTLDGYKVDALT
jgi:hypothetical protein